MSFTAAAKELGITQTALSLHVRSLEAQLGCKLFFRAARNLSLTEVGQAYAYSVRRALSDITVSTASLFGSGSAQVLTVRAPISTATLWLAHRLPKFTRSQPDVSIRLVSNIWADSAGRENVDVELRVGVGDWPDARTRKISTELIVPVAADSASGQSIPVAELRKQPLVQILGFQDMGQKYFEALGIAYSEPLSPYSVDTTVAAIGVVAAGGGYAMVLERFAQTAIDSGQAIAIVGDAVPINQSHFLVETSGTDANEPVKQLFETWLEQEFSEHQ